MIQVTEESTNKIVYTLRITGNEYRPKVFWQGAYTVKVGKGKDAKVLKSVESTIVKDKKTIEVDFLTDD